MLRNYSSIVLLCHFSLCERLWWLSRFLDLRDLRLNVLSVSRLPAYLRFFLYPSFCIQASKTLRAARVSGVSSTVPTHFALSTCKFFASFAHIWLDLGKAPSLFKGLLEKRCPQRMQSHRCVLDPSSL